MGSAASRSASAQRPCALCGSDFQPYDRGAIQRFCNSKCRDRWNGLLRRGKVPLTTAEHQEAERQRLLPAAEQRCERCADTFTPRLTGSVQRFCSEKCQKLAWQEEKRGPVPPRECLTCGRIFLPDDGHVFLCSADCRRRAKIKAGVEFLKRNPEIKLRNGAIYRDRHREKLRLQELDRAGRPEVKEARRERDRANPDRLRSVNQARRARVALVPATLTTAEWQATLAHFQDACAYCGRRGKITQDHFIPVRLGGGWTRENIVPACQSCNSSKNGKAPEAWCRAETYAAVRSYLASRA